MAEDGYFYVIGGRDSGASTAYRHNERLMVGAPAGLTWLSFSPDQGTIPAEGNVPIQVLFRADVPETRDPGTYQAQVRVKYTSPYGALTVPVTMTVSGVVTPTPVPPTATPAPQPTATPEPQPTATPVPTVAPSPTSAPTPTVAPTDIPFPTVIPPEPTPVVQEGTPTGAPTPLSSDELPKTGGDTQGNVVISPDVVRQILGDQVSADVYQLVEVKNGEEKTFTTTTGYVTLTVTSTAIEEGQVVYRWIMVIWNNATELWETVTGEITTAGAALPAFEATATTLRSRIADGGPYDLDGAVNGIVQSRTAMALLGAPKAAPAPTTAPTGAPAGTGGGGCAVQSWGSLLPFALLLLPLVLLGKK